MITPRISPFTLFVLTLSVGSSFGQQSIQDPAAKEEKPKLAIGFSVADANSDGTLTAIELKKYLDDRIPAGGLPHEQIFIGLDRDNDRKISKNEFGDRHRVIAEILDTPLMPSPVDPGLKFVPYQGPNQVINDAAIMGATYHRYREMRCDQALAWKRLDMAILPESTREVRLPGDTSEVRETRSIDALIQATVILVGGGEDFFSAGAVLISKDGLALTNYHVAEAFNDKLMAMASNGKTYQVIDVLAGHRESDVALIRLRGNDFPFVKIARRVPSAGDNITMIHHTENRYYTFDRGYIKRYPRVGKVSFMEISPDYAPGGSGCGIFNAKRELVGLVSTIVYGDGPGLSEPHPFDDSASGDEASEDDDDFAAMLLVKHAVPLTAIHRLFAKKTK